MKRNNNILYLMLLSVFMLTCTVSFAEVIRKNGKTFIRDRKGENWDISQAVSIGFRPYYFEFGLGRNAFSPLDDRSLQSNTKRVPAKLRILGVKGKNESKAFSLKKLSHHEIANSSIDDVPIAAAY